MTNGRSEPQNVEGVDNPIQRRIYKGDNIFGDITGDDGKLKPNMTLTPISDEQLDFEAEITSEDIELAFAELDDNPLLQGLFNATVEE